MCKLSIIVPIYNVEAYIIECLTSIKNQTYSDYEVILINDGSKDNSKKLIEEFILNEKQFKLINKENGGLSDARNFGLNYAQGEYITFLDSDDYIDMFCYEKMMNTMILNDFDIVCANIIFKFNDESNNFILNGIIDKQMIDIQKKALLSPLFAWNKIYKKSYFNEVNLFYPLGLWYEDLPVTLPLFANTSKIGHVDSNLYYYRQRSNSIMASNNQKMTDIFKIFDILIKYFKDNNLYEKFSLELEYLATEHIMLYGQFRFIKNDNYIKLYQDSINYMNNNFQNYKKNLYIKDLGFKNKLFIHTLNYCTIRLYRFILTRRG